MLERVYTTLTRPTAEKTTPLPLEKKAVAVSLVAVTVGPALEEQLASARERQDAMQESMTWAVQQEALQQAAQFAVRLLQEQAKEEECDMASPIYVTQEPLLSSLSNLLGIQRIGIPVDANAPQLPPYARLAWLPWTPVEKRSAKTSGAARAEKTAV